MIDRQGDNKIEYRYAKCQCGLYNSGGLFVASPVTKRLMDEACNRLTKHCRKCIALGFKEIEI